MNYQKWVKINTTDLTNKTAIITGSTGGLGKEITYTLAKLNCNMIFLDKNLENSIKHKNELLAVFPNIDIENFKLDLSNFEEVKIITEKLKTRNIDFLIHNAAVYNVPIYKTSTGYNNIFQINFISPYYITKQLLPSLKKSKAKVIAVGSIAHNYNTLNENDIDFSLSKKNSHIYGNSKRFLMFALLKLFKNNTDVTLSLANPGITLTNITNHYHKSINWLVKIGIKLIFPNPRNASLNIIKSMFTNTNNTEWITPKIFNIWGKPIKKRLKSFKEEEIEKIFEISETIYNNIKN